MTKNELAREVSVSEKLHLSTTVKAIDGTLRVIKDNTRKGRCGCYPWLRHIHPG